MCKMLGTIMIRYSKDGLVTLVKNKEKLIFRTNKKTGRVKLIF